MKRAALLLLLFWCASATGARCQTLAVVADTVHTMGSQGTLKNAFVLIEGGKITRVGTGAPPASATVIRARVVTPGFIDAHATIGVSGAFNEPADQDVDEATDPNEAEVRALDSYNPADPLVRYVLEHGTTTVQVTPGRRNVIGGQAGIFKTHGETADSMALRPVSAVVFSLGELPKETYGGRQKTPQTRMAISAIIRKALNDARAYLEKQKQEDESKRPARDLKLDALARVVSGELPAIITAHREDDIATALRLAREFKLKLVLDAATEGFLLADEIRRSGHPVIAGPVMQRLDAIETMNATLENPALLSDRGIPVSLQTGYESYVPKTRVLLFEAAVAAANGMGFDRALRAITIEPARLLGLADRLGSLEPGKDADVVAFDGDPFEYTTNIDAVVVGGQVAYRRQLQPAHPLPAR